MQIYYTNDSIPYKTAVALGEFDGLHRAHMNLIETARRFAKKNNLPFGIMCFDEKLGGKTGKDFSGRLINQKERIEMLSDCDYIYIQSFNDEFMNMSPTEFCEFLKNKLGASAVFAGFNYRFGKGASGNAELLKGFDGFETYIIDEYRIDGETVSSSAIRNLLANGETEKANKLLGRYYKMSGIIEKGKQNGRKLGFPTANLGYNPEMTLPASGVYAGYTHVAGKRYKSVINVGSNPTFNAQRITIESYIFDFDKDIYGEKADIEFVSYLRSDKKFSSLEELKLQIQSDKKKAEKILSK